MINFGSLSILLILRELLPDSKQALKLVLHDVSSVFCMVKVKGKIKGLKYRMMKYLNRSFVWRQIGSSFETNNQKGVFVYG